jgi:hypothetical protein
MKKYIRCKAVICPFYHSHDHYHIRCDGIADKSSSHVVFGDRAEAKDYLRRFCCDRYQDCRLARALKMYCGE